MKLNKVKKLKLNGFFSGISKKGVSQHMWQIRVIFSRRMHLKQEAFSVIFEPFHLKTYVSQNERAEENTTTFVETDLKITRNKTLQSCWNGTRLKYIRTDMYKLKIFTHILRFSCDIIEIQTVSFHLHISEIKWYPVQ